MEDFIGVSWTLNSMPCQKFYLLGKVVTKREEGEFRHMRDEFHPHNTHYAQLPSNLGNCAMKLCTKNGLPCKAETSPITIIFDLSDFSPLGRFVLLYRAFSDATNKWVSRAMQVYISGFYLKGLL